MVVLIILSSTFFDSKLSAVNVFGIVVSITGVACQRYLNHLDNKMDDSGRVIGTDASENASEKIPEELMLLEKQSDSSRGEEV